MRLASADSQRLIFRGRRPARGALIVGTAFIVVAMSTLLYGNPSNPVRLLTSAVAAAIAALLVRAGWPARRVAVLDLREHRLKADGESHPLDDLRALRLESSLDEDDVPLYRADVELESGRHTLLANSEPEAVLHDLAVVAESTDLPIVVGWGLPDGARPWRASQGEDPSPPPAFQNATMDVSLPEVAAQREIGWSVVIGGGVVATIALFQVGVRLSRGDRPTVMDVLLPVLLVSTILFVGLLVLTKGLKLRMNGALVIEWRMFGLVRKRCTVEKHALRRVYAVGPDSVAATHVLLETERGPVSFPSGPRPAREIAQLIERHL